MHATRLTLPAKLMQPVAWQKWKALAYLAALSLSTIAGARYAGPLPLVVQSACALIGALQFIGLFSLLHESSHGHLAANRRVNAWLGECLCVVVGTSYVGYRLAHLAHHANFRTERDPQEIIYPRRSNAATSALLLVASLVGAPIFLLLRSPYTALKHRQGWAAALRGPMLAVLFYALLWQLLPAPEWRFLVITVGVALLIGSMNDIVYHQGLAAHDSLAACSSFDCDVFGQMFLSGANRHAEHHVYPGVPGPHLVEVSRLVRDDLAAHGAVYDLGFTVAFVRRLVGGPLFLPSHSADESRPRTGNARQLID
ncbi:fatty acid desaturase [Roseateles aquatilis]|uniref:Fatty acid desaturase n=1 Tax=Roseateles aquatilis TaxID=431061 RepID=A0A246JDC6_9BURK|nr:fatty acid desaturase [Roseateles aquatilis]OWQ90662.1 fatty acid desaturase [Roseateles aquatilis]